MRARGQAAGGASGGRTFTAHDRAHRRAQRDRRVRDEVRRLSGCLDSIDAHQRDLLSLRAGLEGGEPQTRGEAAHTLGISRAEARVLEHRGLRALRSTCGGGASPSTLVAHADEMPRLQPAVLLPVTSSGRELVAQDQLGHARQQVKGVERSSSAGGRSGSSSGGSVGSGAPAPGTTLTFAAATTSSSPATGLWLALAAVVGLMAALALLAARGAFGRRTRTAGADAGGERLVAMSPVVAPVAPAAEPSTQPEPEPEPEPAGEHRAGDWQWPAAGGAAAATAPKPDEPEPRADTTPAADQPTRVRPTPVPAPRRVVRRDYARPAKLAAKGASGLISFAAREVRRRRSERR
jgi:hypothetical protein